MFAPMPRPMPMPAPTPAGTPTGAPGGRLDAQTLASLLGSVQVPEPQQLPQAPATFPDMPRAMNPEMTAMILAALQGGGAAPVPSLGQLIGG